MQTAAAVAPGDTITVTLERETTARTVEVPADLRAALVGAGLSDAFDTLAPSHRKEYVRWVEDAKKPETRAKRVAGTIDKLGA